ncbi:MAG: dTDP-4-dehydrorhamnose 3,5-epimerase [Bacteroidales bacterium]|jgi:dTDP-4-dehydrorhamnose 3,5-epimerase|nr:dTDP-4-dehydrorhamnose 3,5-epimerase [Bacteroidales bacterium]MDD2204745.1 dTDP-4-dehydrorhamnose 3,5-epimerase [Bacteroidales bacterium]MDD3151583.1 dTDP-4-dehydrorhamnose 3,5-epimerase [Bacteroidales bacterium]MDD3914168.1 dTDP-4-dehydrorhamnose 3,5-epimerase [Bacteroidales bacterium]MDD4633703.1 dTDP-4-dehydrorhamnose 3,5-epimerase [Bacteroidales bacterium]
MEIIKTEIQDLFVIKPKVFEDARGYFFEAYNKQVFAEFGLYQDFKQDNESKSQRGTIRGLHFQEPPYAQHKLVRVVAGAVFDVAVDIRSGSPTYGKWHGVILTSTNKLMFWIPQGFAHGFQSLEDNTIFQYKCSEYYHPESENSIIWNDADINIAWQNIPPITSSKDNTAKPLNKFISKFSI